MQPSIPPAKRGGRKREVDVRAVLNGVLYVLSTDGGLVLNTLFGRFPFLADGGYQGPVFKGAAASAIPGLEVQIVKRSDAAKGFEVLPKRWLVERSLAWFGRCRPLAKNFENLNRTALALLRLASIRMMLRRLCRA